MQGESKEVKIIKQLIVIACVFPALYYLFWGVIVFIAVMDECFMNYTC